MKKVLFGLALLLPLAACSNTERGAAVGGLGGAAVGCVVANNCVEGAIIGGAIGTVGGAVVGAASDRPGYCEYRDRRGNIYVDRCPSDYDSGPRYRRGRY